MYKTKIQATGKCRGQRANRFVHLEVIAAGENAHATQVGEREVRNGRGEAEARALHEHRPAAAVQLVDDLRAGAKCSGRVVQA